MKVEQILQSKGSNVVTVRDTATIAEAIRILAEKNIGAVVVTGGDGRVAGILSERDIVRRLSSEAQQILAAPVKACMTANVITCRRADTIDQLMSKMTEMRIRHVPVVEGRELVGIVSIGDVVKRKIEESEQEASALREYISS